ncbi:MAG: TerC/Alx family metal homeostasis membrane protein [Pseudomonadales bacterium]
MLSTLIIWLSFVAGITALVILDLTVLHRRAEVMSLKKALAYWAGWVSLAAVFNIYIYFLYENNWLGWGVSSILDLNGREASVRFLTGYLIELSLSMDNVFVIMMIFEFMRVPRELQHRVLFWGILGAIVLRGAMIIGGAALIAHFSWLTYVLGAALILSAARMLAMTSETSPTDILAVRVMQRFVPMTDRLHGERFFIIENGKRLATPLFVALVMVEWADVVFAIDSVPAIFAITTDPFLIFTSNVFAILGLRTLFVVISALAGQMRYLKFSLIFILTYVGAKLIVQHHVEIPSWVSLAVIVIAVAVGAMASLFAASFRRRQP